MFELIIFPKTVKILCILISSIHKNNIFYIYMNGFININYETPKDVSNT